MIPVFSLSLTSRSNRYVLTWLYIRPVTFCFDIGISYLAQASITMRQCVTYIHDPNMTLTFDLKVKFIGFFEMASCLGHSFVSFDSHTYWEHKSITMGPSKYHYHVCLTLTFDLIC